MGATGRVFGVVSIAAITVALAGCIPLPPPLPNAQPVEQGEAQGGEVSEGTIPAGGPAEVTFEVQERAAVMIGAMSPDGYDLTLHLTGQGVDVENDDAYGDVAGFAFEMGSRDPALATVLDPGSYTIAVGEYGDDSSSSYRLQVITSTTTVAAGQSIDLAFGPDQAAIAMVPLTTGDEVLAAASDEDTVMWAYLPAADEDLSDDDGGGDRNPRIVLVNEQPQDIVVVLRAYDSEASGTVRLSVQ